MERYYYAVGIPGVLNQMGSKKFKYLFAGIAVLIIAAMAVLFIQHHMRISHLVPPMAPEATTATLAIQNFRHSATQDGQYKWSIEARTANLYSKENIAELTNLSATFFLNADQAISLKADKGILHTNTNNMELTGNIVVRFFDDVLTTQSLNYRHKSHIINSHTPVTITGRTFSLSANSMSYNLSTDILKCADGVAGTFQHLLEN